MLIGYARVSTVDQSHELQTEQLRNAGCERVFAEQKSGTTTEGREQLEECIEYARPGDTIVVCRLDRLARSLRDLVQIIDRLAQKQVNFQCIHQPALNCDWSNPSPMQKFMFNMLGVVAEFENDVRKERQREGIARAREQKKFKGSAPKYDSKKVWAEAKKMRYRYGWGAAKIARHLKPISKRTLYRIVAMYDREFWTRSVVLDLNYEPTDVLVTPGK
ncbi:MAG: recombinase family protein [Hyphomonadaceae bacterium]